MVKPYNSSPSVASASTYFRRWCKIAVKQNFSYVCAEDAILNVSLTNATSLVGWALQFQLANRFGSESGLITKSAASGYYNGVSGITVLNTGIPNFSVRLNGGDTSGLDSKNYAYQISRTNSGSYTALTQGYLSLLPPIGSFP